MSVAGIQKVSAASQWNFAITAVGNATRDYNSLMSQDEQPFFLHTGAMQQATFSGNTYNINTKEVALQIARNRNYVTEVDVYIDGKSMGTIENQKLLDNFTPSGDDYYYTNYAIKYLTP